MAARMVDAIPTANTNLAGFGAICFPSWQTKSLGRIVRTEPGEMGELLHTSPLVQKMMGLQCPATARRWSLFSALFAAGLTQPNDDPSDHEHGQQERDDHAHADEHIGENYSGAALDGHDARRRFASMPLYGQSSGSPRRFNALSCFNVRLDSPAPRSIFAYRLRRRAPSTCARHAPDA